ncbi:MAG: hypothetical protein K6G32_12170 [Prevotella sp.]|nr:hypothetical protein [Prevotella sp.]
MKQLLRHTSPLLRTALLLAALALICTPTKAQTEVFPDAFETMNPASIIGDGNYYYIQFYFGSDISYLSDQGNGNAIRTKDYIPFAKNIQWTLESTGETNQFRLKSLSGNWAFLDGGYKCTNEVARASTFTFYNHRGGGYEIGTTANPANCMVGNTSASPGNQPWINVYDYVHSNHSYARCCLRIAKLKDNIAHIIYWQEPVYDSQNHDTRNTRGGENGFNKRHYLTYSGTDASISDANFRTSSVSSRSSILPDYATWTIATAAAYHQDGLWTLEQGDINNEFYIKKYGANDYVIPSLDSENWYYSVLGAKDGVNGTYKLEVPNANRYTRIQNNKYQTDELTRDMFKTWDGYGAGATSTGSASVDFNVSNGVQLGTNAMVVGTNTVEHLTYADLSDYSKMIIEGSQNMQLRVLMSRQESNNGPLVEKNVTIGSDGKAVVDLTDLELKEDSQHPFATRTVQATVKMTYICGSDNAVDTSYGDKTTETVTGGYNNGYKWDTGPGSSISTVDLGKKEWGVNNIIYLQVDASVINGTITKATLKANASGNGDRETEWGAGYNDLVWPSNWQTTMTWNSVGDAGRNITDLTPVADRPIVAKGVTKQISLDITGAFTNDPDPDKITTILVYETRPGGGSFSNPVVEVEYTPNVKNVDITYAHLNAIKTGYSSPSGTISHIWLVKESEQNPRYLNHETADGWQVSQKTTNATDWYAGFLPVEVPAANSDGYIEDKFYQVLFRPQEGKMVGTDGTLQDYSSINPALWTLEQFSPNADYQHYRMRNCEDKYKNYPSSGLVNTAPTSGNGVFKNTDIISWNPTWVPKTETRVEHKITHKVSNVRLYYQYNPTEVDKQKVYSQQGLITEALSEWKNTNGTQKVNEFKITHYVKKGQTIEFGLPTTLGTNNDHRLYQRWYAYYDETNLDDLKDHFSLNTSAGRVMSYLYNNGIVTGERLDWPMVFPGANTFESHLFSYHNSGGDSITIAADVSRYSDFTYDNSTSHLDGDLNEPSLTMRYIYMMKDAKEIATKLMTCTGDKWLEKEKIIHFPASTVKYESSKSAAYQGEFLGIKHVFKDYWVFNSSSEANWTDDNLVSAVINNTSGYINVVVEGGNTGITPGGKDNKGYYLYDEGKNNGGKSYGDSRFVAFKYPEGGTVTNTGESNPAYVKVYFSYGGINYQIAKFTIIFDEDKSTLPWKSVNSSAQVYNTDRDPKRLRQIAGEPIAKITFDYPTGATFKNSSDYTIHNKQVITGLWSTIDNSSPLPLKFDNTNYGFDGDNPSWGSYALVTTMPTRYGYDKTTMPASDADYGYNISPDAGMQSAFLYIDASEQPGDICSVPFTGEFCSGGKLMCSGWISGSNKVTNDDRCPGSVTITVKGERPDGSTEDIYRFCPGQCYELDNGTGVDGSTGADHVVWQQFYFEFTINKKYERQWLEVNNNCVSSTGGDFMLDNIEVYSMVPDVTPEMNTPFCVHKNASDMQLLKLTVGFDELLLAESTTEETGDTSHDYSFGIVFLKKDVFLKTFQSGLKNYNGITIALDKLEDNINDGVYHDISSTYKRAYEEAFDAALLGTPNIWDSNNASSNEGAGVMNFHWKDNFSKMAPYSFVNAVNRTEAVYSVTESGRRKVVMNGNYPKLPWELYTDYYIISYRSGITNVNDRYELFNICSECNTTKVFQLKPPISILSMETSDETQDLEVCEGKIPTLLTNLKGYNVNGELVSLKDLNFDWWLGDPTKVDPDNPSVIVTDPTLPSVPRVKATLENYHSQTNGSGIRLDEALYILRLYYPDVTSLDGVVPRSKDDTAAPSGMHTDDPPLTQDMIDYLKTLVDAGQLILHQKSISIPAEKTSDDDPYFYLVACPIHDAAFDQALNPAANKYVAYFCDEPQGLRIKVGEKAPTLKCGFVPNENGFTDYDYSSVKDAVLSIRLAKKAQFEEVQHGNVNDKPSDTYNTTADNDKHFLWLPIRNAEVESTAATGVVRKSGDSNESNNDYNVYLASTDDPVWDKKIYQSMSQTVPSLPIVGKIVKLNAVNTKGKTNVDQISNRLCIYFIKYLTDPQDENKVFEVREGYSYTLSLPYKENAGDNACDGTILINVKIVPDYEVWTGAAGNTDWNNDQNWRRADGNTSTSTSESPDGSKRNNNELYRTDNLPDESPLKDYVTNYTNYRTAKDRILRKGFAPLYCTHVLMKSNEWGDAPVLYDALDGANSFTASPFPNLRDTSTPILKFDMQARHFEKWSEVYGSNPDKGRTGDLLAEMYQLNSCDEIAFQPGAELLNAHLLNYNNAWVEYQLDMNRWYLLGSPLQGTIAGEWYAPTGTAQQKTTYYENVTFGDGYDRYSPAIFQRSWDKAKAVLYEVGSTYDLADNPNDLALTDGKLPGSIQQGTWSGNSWNTSGADSYLDRLGYKPLGNKKANVAIKGVWSNTYNDATVDYANGGFSVMVMNNLKGGSNANPAIIRLPKEDTMYDYYQFSQTGSADGGTDTYLSNPANEDKDDVQTNLNRAKNRGRLKTDNLLPTTTQKTESAASRYGDARTYTRVPTKVGDGFLPMTLRTFAETASPGISGLGYYLVENPFPCGMNMDQFFATNTGLEKKYWLLTADGQHLVQKAEASNEWITQSGNNFTTANAVLAPGQGFFVEATTAGEATTITFNKDMQAQSRYGEQDEGTNFTIVVGTKQKMTTIPVYYDDDDDPDTPEVALMIDDDNNPNTPEVQATMEVPEVDNSGNYVVEDITEKVTIYSYKQTTESDKKYALKARTRSDETDSPLGLVITAQRGDMQSSALVMQREGASNDFLPEEDTETFISSEDLKNVPMVYTLCGRLATTINSIHDFSCLPLGVESASDAPCTLTFHGVEMLGDSIAFYDAVEQKLTPLKSGMQFAVSGQTQNRYYLVRSLNPKEAAEETHLQIFTEGLRARVIASTAEPILVVRCFDTAGRLVYSASPQAAEHSFDLPGNGVYIIEAQTENDRKTKKVMTK